VGEQKLFDISPQEKNQKALIFLVASVSVPCSGMLSGQYNVEADYDRGNFEPPLASEEALHVG
jgi:hypothetical protein